MIQDGETGFDKAKVMVGMLAGNATKMAQMEFDLKKAKYQPDKKFVKDFKEVMGNVNKVKAQLDEVLVKRTAWVMCLLFGCA